MANKKKSPRSIQRTQQDVDRAYERGQRDGVSGALIMFLYTMLDKFNADEKTLTEFSEAFQYVVDSIEKGYITEADLRRVVKEEYGTIIAEEK